MVNIDEKNMALYCAVAWQRDLQRNLDLCSDSSSDEVIVRSSSDVAAVHPPAVMARPEALSSGPSWYRTSYSCPVHHSPRSPPPDINNHHRNCPRAHLHPNPASTITPRTADSSSDPASPVEPESDKSTRWAFSKIICHSRVGSRTAELGYRALWSVITDFLPWIIGSYIIFQAFKYGMLELGLAAFLLMLSVHGVLKWCNARSREKREEGLADYETGAQVDSLCSEHHHHHHHHQDHDLSDTDFSSSDDSDLEDDSPSIGKVVVVIDEPPPSYEVVSRATGQDVELDLQVHLTPRHPRGEYKDTSIRSATVYSEEIDDLETEELARPSLLPRTSCMSSEVEDDSLPSYSDAVKKIKRKKKRSLRSRVRRIENGQLQEDETHTQRLNFKGLSKMGDTAPATSYETPAGVQPSALASTNCNPACVTAVHEAVQQEDFINIESTLPSRVNASDMNSLLDVDSCSSLAPEREPYV